MRVITATADLATLAAAWCLPSSALAQWRAEVDALAPSYGCRPSELDLTSDGPIVLIELGGQRPRPALAGLGPDQRRSARHHPGGNAQAGALDDSGCTPMRAKTGELISQAKVLADVLRVKIAVAPPPPNEKRRYLFASRSMAR